MKKSVFNYVLNHRNTDIHAIAKALNLEEMQVLKVINELIKDSYIQMDTPTPLCTNNQNSCYYSVTGKQFADN